MSQKLCKDCKHSFLDEKSKRRCSAIDGNPFCINVMELFWEKYNRKRECGPEGNLFQENK